MHSSYARLSVLAALLVASASAQDLTQLIGSLSTSCQAAAGGLLTSDFGTCANIMGLVPVIGASGSALSSLSSWVSSICPTAPCSDSTVASAAASVKSGCGDDVAKGVGSAVAISTIVTNYAPVRKMFCEQYASNSSFCANTLLAAVEKSGKTVTVTLLESILVEGFPALAPSLAALPKDAYCNDCGHALYTDMSAFKTVGGSASGNTSANALATAACGASFVDGKVPSTIQQASGSSSSSSGSASSTGSTAAHSAQDSAGALLKCSSAVVLLSVAATMLMSIA